MVRMYYIKKIGCLLLCSSALATEQYETALGAINTREHLVQAVKKLATLPESKREELLKALDAKNWDQAKEILQEVGNPNIEDNEYGTLLHRFCATDNKEVVEFLVQQAGIDVTEKDQKGNSPFLLALLKDHLGVAEVISQYGGPMLITPENQKDGHGVRFLRKFIQEKKVDIVKFLLKHHFQPEPGDFEGAEYILEKFAPHEKIVGDETIIYPLIWSGDEKALEFLINKDKAYLSPPLVNEWQMPPFFAAISSGKIRIVELFINGGADIHQSWQKKTPLCQAASMNIPDKSEEVVRLLLKKGGNPNARCTFGDVEQTPLFIAVRNQNKSMVDLLLKEGADPDAANRSYAGMPEQTSLFIAVLNNNPEIVESLLRARAKPYIKNRPAEGALELSPLSLALARLNQSAGSLDQQAVARSRAIVDLLLKAHTPQTLQEILKKRKTLTPEEIRKDPLPTVVQERDVQLRAFYNETIPLLLSWQIAHHKSFDFLKGGAPELLMMSEMKNGMPEKRKVYLEDGLCFFLETGLVETEKLLPEQLPAIIKSQDGTSYKLVIMHSGAQHTQDLNSVDIKLLEELFQKNQDKKKVFLNWDNPIMQAIALNKYPIISQNGINLQYTVRAPDGNTVARILDTKIYQNLTPESLPWHAPSIVTEALKNGDILENYQIPEGLLTPFPYDPYRELSMDKLFLFPGNIEQWNDALAEFKRRKLIHERIVKDCGELLEEIGSKFTFDGIDEKAVGGSDIQALFQTLSLEEKKLVQGASLLKSLLTGPAAYTENTFKIHNLFQNTMTGLLQGSIKAPTTTIKVSGENKQDITNFKNYHDNQLRKINYFLEIIDPIIVGTKDTYSILNPEDFFKFLPYVIQKTAQKKPSEETKRKLTLTQEEEQVKEFRDTLRHFFLGGRKPAHDLINVGFLQGKAVGDLEVIVYDSEHHYSRHLAYSPLAAQSYLSKEEKKDNSSQATLKKHSHSTAVAGVIGAEPNLEQLKGVAPGAKILPVRGINRTTLDLMRKSTARVINMSVGLSFPKACLNYFQEKNAEISFPTQNSGKMRWQPSKKAQPISEGEKCALLWEFVKLIEEKDMIVIDAAGNEGLPLEEVNWKTGIPTENLTNNARGLQHVRSIEEKSHEGDAIDVVHIFRQIPQLRNRFILVGNLRADGVTIAPSSSLPGAFPEDFIFAPSDDISSLYGSVMVGGKRYGEIGSFGGTSGAAPRVTGVMALLGRIFPDLPMTEIRQCILESGDPFWLSPANKFIELKTICGETLPGKSGCLNSYGQRIFGQGRINAETAYALCFQKNEERRKSKKEGGKGSQISMARSEDYSRLSAQDKDNPFYQILGSSTIELNLIKEVEAYYSNHPQKPIIDKESGFTSPLRKAIDLEGKWPGLIEALLKSNPKLKKQEATDIMSAAILKDRMPLSLFEFLLKNKADPNVNPSKVASILVTALLGKKYDVAALLVDAGAKLEDFAGMNLLIVAAHYNQLDFAKSLLKRGMNLNIIDANGKTPLTLAIQQDNYNIATLLVDAGAKLENYANINLLIVAAHYNQLDFAKSLLKRRADLNINSELLKTAFEMALGQNHYDLAALLLDAGADVDFTKYANILTVAAFNNQFVFAESLVKKGANPNENHNGMTPLGVVLERHFNDAGLKFAKLLLENGASPNIKNSSGETPLLMACLRGKFDFVKFLLEKRADPNIADEDGNTPLMVTSNPELAKLLLQYGARREPALKLAIQYPIFMKVLLDHNIDHNKEDLNKIYNGETLLKTAVDNKNADIVELLLHYGAQPTPESNAFLLHHKTALEFLGEFEQQGIALPNIMGSDGPKVASAFKDELKKVLIAIMETSPNLTLMGTHAALEKYIRVRNEVTADQMIPRKFKAYNILRANPQFDLNQVKEKM